MRSSLGLALRALLLIVFCSSVSLSQEAKRVVADSPSVETTGNNPSGGISLITKNAGRINFYTNKILRWYIDESTGNLVPSGSSTIFSGFTLPNDTYILGTNAAGSATINLLKLDSSDNTVINSSASDDLRLQLEDDPQRLINFAASSDTALTIKFGDGGTTATQGLFFGSSTADSDDDSTLTMGGGGAGSAGRGAFVKMQGAEATGDLTLSASSSNSSGVRLLAPAASGAFYDFSAGGNSILGLDASGNITMDATNGGNFVAAKMLNGAKSAILGAAALTSDVSGFAAPIHTFSTTGQIQMTNLIYGNTANDQWVAFLKSRSATADANTIVNASDGIVHLVGYGANGTAFDPAAAIDMIIDGTPGAAADMPGAIIFKTSPDGSATLAQVLKLGNDKAATFAGALTSTATGALGWSYVTGADTACTTTCTNAAVFGVDLAGGATAPVIVDAASATADACVCAGAS